ncbi:MAG: alpha/beta fold hydrolase [Chloroflexi bacterium]|nr:alpha/beta fold hydrolase [Chloroflexota bacterium]MDA1146763.1 alpha/beta fold hydrolase [Chloroflexota bacterium]MQC82867.1 alpha/beta fold hydrolase [Chloroflexota bacterium]
MPQIETSEGIQIRYDDRGPRDGRPLVLAHGFGVSLEMWMPQLAALSAEHRLITWDARGHGGSSAPADPESYSMAALSADLRALLETIEAVEDAVIGGMSFGGQIALQYAVDHPADVHALILSDSTTRGSQPPGAPSASMAAAYGGDAGLEGCMHAMRTRPDLTPQLASLDIPTLVIVGEHDEMILPGLDRLVDALPRRRIVRLAGCSHGTSGQRPGAWNEAVLEFLEDVDEEAGLGEDLIA